MHVLVAAKQVLDPDGVNSYALWGRLRVAASGREFEVGDTVPRIINAYDEQAMEAALRLRDAGVDGRITAVAIGSPAASDVLKRCVAMGADASILVDDPEAGAADGFRTAELLAAVARELGDVDLVICGRQGSDFDQGTVPGVLAELLGAALVTMAAGIEVAGDAVRVRRATPHGEEVVEATLPAVVSVSNELGLARYPSSRGMLAARRTPPQLKKAEDLVATSDHRVQVRRLMVPDVQGHCEVIEGATPGEKAAALVNRLEEMGVLRG